MQEVCFSYPGGARKALEKVTLRVGSREFVCLLGPNGAGKTTLLRVASGLSRPQQGTVLVCGMDPCRTSRRRVARIVTYVPPSMEVLFPMDVSAFVQMARYPYSRGFFEGAWERQRTEDALSAMGVAHLAHRQVGELSSGERKLVLLARALAQGTRLILLDEPTAHLDIARAVEALDVFFRAAVERGVAVVATIHDLNVALLFATKVGLMKDGKILDFGEPEETVLYPKLTRLYGCDVYIGRNELNGKLFVVPMKKPETSDRG